MAEIEQPSFLLSKSEMKNKTYYLHGYHQLIYVHDETETDLVLGGRANFFDDARTNIYRQQISKDMFDRLRPLEVEKDKQAGYSFLEKEIFHGFATPRYRVRGEPKLRDGYLKAATPLPYAEIITAPF